jgi:hypothetical protein
VQANLQAIRAAITEASLPAELEQTVLWRFDQLPKLYADLKRTYESRYSDRILVLVQGILKALAAEDVTNPETVKLAEKIIAKLQKMHDKHGLAHVGLKPPAAPKPVRKKKVVAKAK